MHSSVIKSIADKLKPSDYIIAMGDFNIPTTSWITSDDTDFLVPISPNDCTQDFLASFTEMNVFQINDIYNSNGRLLDLVFVNCPALFDISRTNPLCLPEDRHHPTIAISAPLTHKPTTHKIYESLCFKRTDYSKLNQLLCGIDWVDLLDCKNNESNFYLTIHKFYSVLKECVSASTPLMKIVNCNRPPWFSNTMSWLRNRRNRLYKKFKKTRNPIDRSLYLIAGSRFNLENKKCYSLYIAKMKMKIKQNPKLFYNFVNSKRKVSSYPSSMKINGLSFSNDNDIANCFADFFSTTFSTMDYNNSEYPYYITKTILISTPLVNVSTVLNNLKCIKNSYKPGPDGIPSCILRNCADVLAEPITYIFKCSLKFGLFPSCWKESYIIPLHKSGSRSDISNYRAIAKLNAIPKLFEKIIADNLIYQLPSILSPSQHGFCRGRSTCTNLLELTCHINSSFCNSLQTDVIYTDFSKAFDKVNHDLLLFKLDAIGFSGNFLKWINSYLKHRTQCVLFNNSKSKLMKVTSGVPQGSHLGPLLFLMFINDLPNAIEFSKILMYADDVKLFSSITDDSDSVNLQADLDNFYKWCNINLMELNLKKCKSITFCRYSPINNLYNINGTELDSVNTFLDLGVLFDKKLSFNSHVILTVNKAYGVLCFIKRWAKEFKDPYITKNLFTSLVRPILEYASVVWDPQYNIYIKKLESVQKQFLLFCLRNLGWNPDIALPPYRSRLALINLPTLKSRRVIFNITFLFNLIHGNIDSKLLLEKIHISVPNRQLRSYEPLYLQPSRSNYINFDPFRRICMEFNKMYTYIDFSDSAYMIKRRLLVYLNSSSYRYDCF